MYYFFMFGIFSNTDVKTLLAWLDIPPSSQAAAHAKPGSKLPLAALMLPGRSSKLSVIPTSRGKTTKPPFTALKSHAEPSQIRNHKAF